MNAAYDVIRSVDDLAAHWTDPVLGIVKAAGMRHISVDMELGNLALP